MFLITSCICACNALIVLRKGKENNDGRYYRY